MTMLGQIRDYIRGPQPFRIVGYEEEGKIGEWNEEDNRDDNANNGIEIGQTYYVNPFPTSDMNNSGYLNIEATVGNGDYGFMINETSQVVSDELLTVSPSMNASIDLGDDEEEMEIDIDLDRHHVSVLENKIIIRRRP